MRINKHFSHSISISLFSSAVTEVEVFSLMTAGFVTADWAISLQSQYITLNNNWWCTCLQTPEWSSSSHKVMGNPSANSKGAIHWTCRAEQWPLSSLSPPAEAHIFHKKPERDCLGISVSMWMGPMQCLTDEQKILDIALSLTLVTRHSWLSVLYPWQWLCF